MKNETQTAAADYRSCIDRAHNLLQLRQAGFSHDQIQALAAVMGDAGWEAMRPFMERVDWRFSAMERNMDGREWRVDELERRTGGLERRADDERRRRADSELRRRPDEAERSFAAPERGRARMRPQEWMFLTVLGLGLTGVAAAVLLATRIIG